MANYQLSIKKLSINNYQLLIATTGSILRVTSGGSAISANYTGNVVDISPARTLTAAATRAESGTYLNVQRANTTNNAGAIMNITGALTAISSNCTVTLGTCTDASNLLSLTQSYTSASGALLNVIGAGTGNLATLDASNASANGVSIDVQSSSASQYAFKVTSNNAGINGLYVRADGNVGIDVDDVCLGGGVSAAITQAWPDGNT